MWKIVKDLEQGQNEIPIFHTEEEIQASLDAVEKIAKKWKSLKLESGTKKD